MSDAYLKVKDNGAQGLALMREETDTSVSELKTQINTIDGVVDLETTVYNNSQIDATRLHWAANYLVFSCTIQPGKLYHILGESNVYYGFSNTGYEAATSKYLDRHTGGTNREYFFIAPNYTYVFFGCSEANKNAICREINLSDSLLTVSPISYGAVGDGVTDDTNALQMCLSSGVRVDLKGKSYFISQPLNFDGLNNVEFYNGAIVRAQDQTFNTIVGGSATNIYIHDVIFDGNGNNQAMQYEWKDNIQACVILASDCQMIRFEENTVKNYNYGVFVLGAQENITDYGSFNCSINGNIFDNCNSVIDTYGKNVEIRGNSIFNTTENAIQYEPNKTLVEPSTPIDSAYYSESGYCCIISGNYIVNTAGIAINIHSNTLGVSVENNTIIKYGKGISMTRTYGGRVIGNTIVEKNNSTYTPEKHVWSYTAAIEGSNCVIKNNYIRNCDNGIYSVGGCIITDNLIEIVALCAVVQYATSDNAQKITVVSNNIMRELYKPQNAIDYCCMVINAYGYMYILGNVSVSSSRGEIFNRSEAKCTVKEYMTNTTISSLPSVIPGYNTYSTQ